MKMCVGGCARKHVRVYEYMDTTKAKDKQLEW